MPSLSALLGNIPQEQPLNAEVPASPVSVPSLSKLLSTTSDNSQVPITKETTGSLGTAFAASDMFLQGVNNAANNVLKTGAHLLYGKLLHRPDTEKDISEGLDIVHNAVQKGLEPKGDFETRAMVENPRVAGLAGAIGDIPTQIGLYGKALNPIAESAVPIVGKATPIISASPKVQGAITQGIVGGGINAALNPEHPVSSFLMGAVPSGLVGAETGELGHKINRAGEIINDQVKNAMDIGVNPYSPENIATLDNNLKSNGLILRSVDLKNTVKAKIAQYLDQIRPNTYTPEESPINVVSKAAATNFKDTVQEVKDAYKPIDLDTNTFTPTSFKTAIEDISLNKKIHMPDLPNKPMTLQDMLAYRRQLDSTISQANKLSGNGSITQMEASKLYPLRTALNNDIHASAKSIGLEDQLNSAEDLWNNKLQPFAVFGKIGNLKDKLQEADVSGISDAVWKKLNKQLQARFPNPAEIKQVAETLGPQGRDLVGWAKIENDYRVSTVGGVFNPTTFASRIAKSENSGLNDIIMSPAHQEVVDGLQDLMKTTKEWLPKEDHELATGVVGKLIQSRSGLQLLKTIGSQKPSIEATKTILQQLLTGTLALGVHNLTK